jgi:hypothetical protein
MVRQPTKTKNNTAQVSISHSLDNSLYYDSCFSLLLYRSHTKMGIKFWFQSLCHSNNIQYALVPYVFHNKNDNLRTRRSHFVLA